MLCFFLSEFHSISQSNPATNFLPRKTHARCLHRRPPAPGPAPAGACSTRRRTMRTTSVPGAWRQWKPRRHGRPLTTASTTGWRAPARTTSRSCAPMPAARWSVSPRVPGGQGRGGEGETLRRRRAVRGAARARGAGPRRLVPGWCVPAWRGFSSARLLLPCAASLAQGAAPMIWQLLPCCPLSTICPWLTPLLTPLCLRHAAATGALHGATVPLPTPATRDRPWRPLPPTRRQDRLRRQRAAVPLQLHPRRRRPLPPLGGVRERGPLLPAHEGLEIQVGPSTRRQRKRGLLGWQLPGRCVVKALAHRVGPGTRRRLCSANKAAWALSLGIGHHQGNGPGFSCAPAAGTPQQASLKALADGGPPPPAWIVPRRRHAMSLC